MLLHARGSPARLFFATVFSVAAIALDVEKYIILEKTGGFAVGGKIITNATGDVLSCDHGYMEYFIPAKPRKTSVVMWHASSTQVSNTSSNEMPFCNPIIRSTLSIPNLDEERLAADLFPAGVPKPLGRRRRLQG